MSDTGRGNDGNWISKAVEAVKDAMRGVAGAHKQESKEKAEASRPVNQDKPAERPSYDAPKAASATPPAPEATAAKLTPVVDAGVRQIATKLKESGVSGPEGPKVAEPGTKNDDQSALAVGKDLTGQSQTPGVTPKKPEPPERGR